MEIKQQLDEALLDAKERKKLGQICNVCIINGPSGCGKTSIIREWLKENNVRHYWLGGCREQILDGMPILFATNEIDTINDGKTICIFDNYDWIPLKTRKHIFNLIKNLTVIDYRERMTGNISGERKLDNIFMIIVVTHPELHTFAEDYTEEEKEIFGEHTQEGQNG